MSIDVDRCRSVSTTRDKYSLGVSQWTMDICRHYIHVVTGRGQGRGQAVVTGRGQGRGQAVVTGRGQGRGQAA
jgi:hypothetical protein